MHVTGLIQQLRRRARFFAAIAAVAGAALLASLFDRAPEGHAPKPVRGVLDLSQWDFARSGSVSLAGEWLYVDASFADAIDEASAAQPAQVPGAWPAVEGQFGFARPRGFGTYFLKVTLPPADRGRLALETGYVLSAYRVYANGKAIAASGVPAAVPEREIARAYSLTAPLPASANTVELHVEISNHLALHGGFFSAPAIGLERMLSANKQTLVLVSMFLIGAMFFAACYHFAASVLARGSGETFWFAVFAALLALRTALIEPIAPFALAWLSQDWVWRIDYAASILLLPAAYQFFTLSFPRYVSTRYGAPIVCLCLIGATATLAGGVAIGEIALKCYEVVALAAIAYLTQAIGRAAWAQERGGSLALTGWLLSAGATVHDILLDNGLIAGPNLIPFGFLAFVLCLSATMVARFGDAYRSATQSSRDMKALNETLESAVNARTGELSMTIDELRRSQAELKRAKVEADSANAAKSRFLATMSHELRTPLNSILGFAELIRSEAIGPLGDARYAEYAGDIHNSGSHLMSLINDILDLSRIDAGKLELRDEPIDVKEIVGDALSIATARGHKSVDSVSVVVEAELPPLQADRRAVLQMIINLLSNALKFTPDGGRIVLAARRVGGGGIAIAVSDEGIGMAREDIPKALAAFSQVDDGHARRHEGTGLGLAIVKSLVEVHGGTLTLESEKGRGTVATLSFPACRTLVRNVAAA